MSSEGIAKVQRVARHALFAVGFVLGYLALSLPQVTFITQLGFTAWYPAIGWVVASLLGVSPWYGIFVALADALASRWIYHQSLANYSGTLGVIGCAACYAFAAHVLRDRLRIDPGLPRRLDVVQYLSVTAIAALGSAVIGVSCLLADRAIGLREYWSSMVVWFIGDGIGVVGVAPFLLIYFLPQVRRALGLPATECFVHPAKNRTARAATMAESVGQVLALIGILWIMFSPRFGNDKYFLGLIPILWIAMRFGIRGSAAGALAINFGVVVAMRIFPPQEGALGTMGLLMLVISSVGLLVGASVTERDRISGELNERTSYLHSVIENSPFGIVVLDRQGQIEFVNRSFEELALFKQDELSGRSLDELFSAEHRSDMPEQWCARVIAGQAIHHAFTWRRKDTSIAELQMDAVPLVVEGRVRGAYIVYRDISQQIRAAEIERKNTDSLNRLVCELEIRTSQMAVLNEMGSLLECCATLEEAGEVISHCVRKLFPEALSGSFFMSNSASSPAEAISQWGRLDANRSSEFGLQECWALRRGLAHWSVPGQGVVCRHVNPSAEDRFLCLPLTGKEGNAGILQLEFAPEEGWLSDNGPESRHQSQERLGATVAAHIAHALASLKLRETLRDQSIRDSLTGPYNRRFMVESLERELLRAARNGGQLSMMFIDLDHFKKFNDTFGHEAGDLVLRSMADLFQDFFRGNDLICRYGGEEFAILLPDCATSIAASRADSLRIRTRSTVLRYEGRVLDPVTLSIGIAAFPDHAATATDLLKVADGCLYDSKARGRDATTTASVRRAAGSTG